MSATVAPEKLANALNRKVAEANDQIAVIWKSEGPDWSAADARAAVNHFLTSARGVWPVAYEFGRQLPRRAFDKWLAAWEAKLTPNQLALWKHMKDQRDARENGDGPAVVDVQVELPQQHVQQNGLTMGLPPLKFYKFTIRFAEYPGELASSVCTRYLELCGRFVADLLRDHDAVIQARISAPEHEVTRS